MRFACLIILFALSSSVFAQQKKFGNVKKEDFTSYNQKYDTTASAVVLFDVGSVYFSSTFDCYFERHVRIKILKEDGFEYGDVSIFFNEEYDQTVNNIKAQTYNLDENGSVKKVKLSKRDIFKEKIIDDINAQKFTLPKLSEGAIIEYSYKKKMGNAFLFPDWKFHKEIPVSFSEFEMRIPGQLQYQTIIKGVDTTATTTVERYTDSMGGGQVITISKTDLPPVEDLPFIDSTEDFVTEIYTQLAVVDFPGQPRQTFYKTWEKVADEVRGHPAIGKQRLNGDMKKAVDALIEGKDNPLDKMIAIYDHVAGTISWDGFYGLITDRGIRDAYSTKAGNAADVNLMLMEMLNYAGVEATYSLISTRNHGKIIANYPIINQFNHLIVLANINGELVFLDATEGERSYKLLPVKDLYRYAFTIEDKSFEWYRTVPQDKSAHRSSLNIEILEDARMSAKLTSSYNGYYAHKARNEIKNISKDRFIEEQLKTLIDVKVDSFSIDGLTEKEKPLNLEVSYTFGEASADSVLPNMLYIQPLSIFTETKNPFVRKEREFPVIFPYPFREQVIVNITIPEVYEVEELPEPVQLRVGNGLASFRFLNQQGGNKVTVLSDFSFDEIEFAAGDYEAIKTTFEKVVSSHAQPIILRKKS